MSAKSSPGGTKKQNILEILESAPLHPVMWNEVCDALSEMVEASGALLIPYDVEDRTLAMPHSPRLAPALARYIETGWHRRDFRTQGFPKALSAGYVTDQDLISVDDMRRHPYYEEWLTSVGLRWFVGFCFQVGSKTWGAAIHGTAERGAFLSGDVETLLKVRNHLSLAAKQTAAIGSQRITSLETTFAAAHRGTAVLASDGRIAWLNARADELLRSADLVSQNRLRSLNEASNKQLSGLLERALTFRPGVGTILTSPVRVFTADERTLVIDVIPMPRDFQSLLSSAAAVVTIHEVETARQYPDRDFKSRFKLTTREVELCVHLLAGRKLVHSAALMGTSVATARQYAKSIFAKTDTHSQGELVALLRNIPYDVIS